MLVSPFLRSSFHELLERADQLVYDLVLAVADIIDDAGADMAGKQLLIECVHRGVHRSGLDKDIRAVGPVFDHALDAPDLPLYAVEAVHQRFIFLR